MISDSIFVLLLFSTLRLAFPLILSAIGGYFSEKAGVAQLALESFLLIGAFSAASITYFSQSLALGYLSAGLAAVVLAQVFCLLVLKLKANAVVIGTGLNLLAMGLIPLISKAAFDSTGSTPSIDLILADLKYPLMYPLIVLFFFVTLSFYLSEKTLWGLQIKFAGEKKMALAAIGVSASARQWQAITLCALITGCGGAILSTYLASSYSPLMSAGRGYIALAAIIFSGWNLPKAVLISIFFGFCEAVQIQAQSNAQISALIPSEFIQMTPYLLTLIALIIFKSKQQPPSELK